MKHGFHIATATVNDCASLASVHAVAFNGFFLTRMGPRFLKVLYAGFCELDGGVCLVARDNRRVIGFLAGTTRPVGFFRELLLKRWWRFAWAAVSGILRNPREVTKRCSSAVLYRGDRPSNIAGQPALLSSLAVLPECGGRGVGKMLVESFCAQARDGGCDSVYLLTDHSENESVNQFYKRCGFELLDTINREGGRIMNRWSMTLG
jgi:ribosomal protein S18 acetylase RimI-like enzyme